MEVKIYLTPEENEDEVTEALIKAMQSHAAGENHREDFHQPAARDVFNKMINAHNKMFEAMLLEINKVLDEEAK